MIFGHHTDMSRPQLAACTIHKAAAFLRAVPYQRKMCRGENHPTQGAGQPGSGGQPDPVQRHLPPLLDGNSRFLLPPGGGKGHFQRCPIAAELHHLAVLGAAEAARTGE